MDPLTFLHDWGGWVFGGVVGFFGLRDGRIDERIRVVVNPELMASQLESIANDVISIRTDVGHVKNELTEIGKKVEYLRGRGAAAE